MRDVLLVAALLLALVAYGLIVLIEADRTNRRNVQRARAWNTHVTQAMTVARHPTGFRCLLCPTNPPVDDPETHTRLVHAYRARGPEDTDWWAAR